MTTSRARRSRAGFTIVEVVLAMFVLLVGMTSILGLLTFGAALSRTAQLRNESAWAVEAIVADLEETLFPLEEGPDGREVVGEPVPVEGRAVPGRPGLSYTATATPLAEPRDASGLPVAYRVDVEITWTQSGTARARRFSTVLLREVPFGERLRRRFVHPGAAPGADAPPEDTP